MDKVDQTHTNAPDNNSTGYAILPSFYRKSGYDYKLVKRIGDVAIFEQSDEGRIFAYEVFEIRKQKAAEFNEIKYEAKEKVPSSEQWGQNAYTVKTIERAEIRLNQILQSINERNENRTQNEK